MARILVLGGGFGGIAAAHRLREIAPEHDVTLVDRGTDFLMGFRKNDAVLGRSTIEASSRPLSALAAHGIEVVQAEVKRFDPAGRAVDADGRTIEADAVVVALGAERVPEAVPGLAEHGRSFYDLAALPAAADAFGGLERGMVVVGIFGAPYTCPPAPYELAILAAESAADRGRPLQLTAFTPQPMSLPVLGPVGCEALEGRLAVKGIAFRPNAKPERVTDDRVVLQGGDEIPFDLLLAVPPHRCPDLLVESGLAEPGGWIAPDPATMETRFEGVYAIGDCTMIPLANGQPLPKAGVLAESEGRVAAERIAARLAGRDPEATFDGRGACWLEVGGGEAMMVRGSFLARPAPEVELAGPSAGFLEEKVAYERDRLATWFGPGTD